MISIFLHIGNISDGQGGLFGDDVLTKWVQKDNSGQFTGTYASSLNSSKIYNPSTSTTNSGTSLLNFWDITQLVWDFVVLIANIVFAIPNALFFVNGIPYIVKISLVLPIMIIGITVLIFGIFGRR